MRRAFNEITDRDTIGDILGRTMIGRLATIGEDGYPYITAVNYVYFRGAIYFHCASSGEKLDNIGRDNRVCFAVDRPLAYLDTAFDKSLPACEVGQFYQSVVIRGRAEIVDELEEKVAALNALMAVHEGVADFSGIKGDSKAVKLCHVVAVRIESLSAKANLGQKKEVAERQRIADYLRRRGQPGDDETARLLS
jgi:nitroimidazol reductase NimA-like FMN-containing flavoprotein (pyridoxamine 5'-phosphate oxidase superfamily)